MMEQGSSIAPDQRDKAKQDATRVGGLDPNAPTKPLVQPSHVIQELRAAEESAEEISRSSIGRGDGTADDEPDTNI
jgi:hypothetical protein